MPRTAHARMLRLGRHSEEGRIYLITLTCRGRRPCFEDLYSGRCFPRALIATRAQADTLCYVVMPDHAHWLMQLRPGADLSATVRKVKSLTSRYRRLIHPATDTLWQRGFHDRALRKEEGLTAAARYVVANPLRAGLVDSVWRYSLWDAIWLERG